MIVVRADPQDHAVDWLRTEVSPRSTTKHQGDVGVGYAYLGLDDREQAMNWLGKACEEHSSILQFLKVNPDFDSLRSDPRFRLLTRRVGLG